MIYTRNLIEAAQESSAKADEPRRMLDQTCSTEAGRRALAQAGDYDDLRALTLRIMGRDL